MTSEISIMVPGIKALLSVAAEAFILVKFVGFSEYFYGFPVNENVPFFHFLL